MMYTRVRRYIPFFQPPLTARLVVADSSVAPLWSIFGWIQGNLACRSPARRRHTKPRLTSKRPNGSESAFACARSGRLRSCQGAPSCPLCSSPSKPRRVRRCAGPCGRPQAPSHERPVRNVEASHPAPEPPERRMQVFLASLSRLSCSDPSMNRAHGR
jgi:hypothetical protein